jgi:hypothetical protein
LVGRTVIVPVYVWISNPFGFTWMVSMDGVALDEAEAVSHAESEV